MRPVSKIFMVTLCVFFAAAAFLIAQTRYVGANRAMALMPNCPDPCGEAISGPDRSVGQLVLETSSGVIDGDGPNNTIVVYAMEHKVEIPYDLSSGMPTGSAVRGPYKFRKRIDKGSPLIMQALVNNSAVQKARFDHFDGSGTNDYTMELENGLIVGFETVQVKRCDGSYVTMEEISIIYRRITYTHHPSGSSFQDSF